MIDLLPSINQSFESFLSSSILASNYTLLPLWTIFCLFSLQLNVLPEVSSVSFAGGHCHWASPPAVFLFLLLRPVAHLHIFYVAHLAASVDCAVRGNAADSSSNSTFTQCRPRTRGHCRERGVSREKDIAIRVTKVPTLSTMAHVVLTCQQLSAGTVCACFPLNWWRPVYGRAMLMPFYLYIEWTENSCPISDT